MSFFPERAGREYDRGLWLIDPSASYRAGWRRSARLSWSVLLLLLPSVVAGWAAAGLAGEPAVARYQGSRRSMGVTWSVSLFAADAAKATACVTAALDEVSRLESLLSDYQPESELCRLSRAAPTAQPIPVGPDLWQVLVQAVAFRDRSGGAFDPTIGPLTTLWRQARRSGRLPTEARLAAARQATGPETLELAASQRAVSLLRPGMRLDLGGIGMGYAIDRALAVLRGRGITVAMVDASGDIGVIGCPPRKRGWRIELDPFGRREGKNRNHSPTVITLVDAAITTSGDAFQAVAIDGVRYSHIVDPRTGLGIVGPTGVTVIAPTAAQADALATTLSVLGPKEGLPMVEATPGAAARFVRLEDGKPAVTASARWPAQSAQSSQGHTH